MTEPVTVSPWGEIYPHFHTSLPDARPAGAFIENNIILKPMPESLKSTLRSCAMPETLALSASRRYDDTLSSPFAPVRTTTGITPHATGKTD
jgi:hypothetical protein